ncbi:uncharacterized protein LOC105848291 isoform X3 [Hydra vulgaris]|uniref:Uncharacterized protein LOC105848291 isoform X3 n=1 Tax=Hydra vulgaris TaxID=6087 RepID=A0ABM4DKA6_HYDVU
MTETNVRASELWEHFEDCEPDADGVLKAKCRLCTNVTLRRKNLSTAALWGHLKSKHKKIATEVLEKKASRKRQAAIESADILEAGQKLNQCDKGSGSLQSPSNSKKLREESAVSIASFFQPKYSTYDKRQLQFDLDFMRCIVALSRPFSVADHEEIKEFFKKQLPRVTVKNSTTFAKFKLPLLYEQIHKQIFTELEQELPEVDGFALTSDMWTSRANEAYMSLTLHFVNRNFNLIKKVISCKHFPGSHTAVAIAVEIDKQIESLPNVKSESEKVVVHDAAANMRASFPNSSQLSHSLLCADHAINLVLQKAVEGCEPIQKAITKATLLSSKTHRSTLANELIKKACKDVGE